MNRSVNIIGIAILLVIASSFSSCKSLRNETIKESSNLKIISYNVWYGFTKVPERKESWIAWMKEQDPDIISLQELNEYNQAKLAEDANSYG
ncbi:MAG: hypothetical protein IMY68_11090, partial [Bacteroidetes bacterium]|nr:hypothetical protein [Bacteroidota bacterium]